MYIIKVRKEFVAELLPILKVAGKDNLQKSYQARLSCATLGHVHTGHPT